MDIWKKCCFTALLVLRESDCRDRQKPAREKAEDEQNPWEEYRTAAESAKLSVELAAKAAEEARELFARELRVSVIIPSKDNPSVLGKCLRSLTQRPEGSVPVEILLIDNGSNEENRKKTEQLVEEIRTAGTPIRYVYEPAGVQFFHHV